MAALVLERAFMFVLGFVTVGRREDMREAPRDVGEGGEIETDLETVTVG